MLGTEFSLGHFQLLPSGLHPLGVKFPPQVSRATVHPSGQCTHAEQTPLPC